MLKALIKIRLQSLINTTLQSSQNKKALKILLPILLVYAFFSVAFSFGTLFMQICYPLCNAGFLWLYFAIVSLLCFCLCFLTSVFSVSSQLFEAKDNEHLLSMPIPPRYVLLSRLSVIFAANTFFELLIAIPAGIIYLTYVGADAVGVLLFIALFAILPFVVMPISCIFGWLIALITSKLRNRSVFTTGLYVILLVGYFAVYGKINSFISELAVDGAPFAQTIKSVLPPFYYFGSAIADHNLFALLIFFLCALIPSVIVFTLISRSYFSIMMSSHKLAKIKYVESDMKVSSAFAALTKKEMRFFLSRPNYIMNSGVGLIMMVIAAIFFVVKSSDMSMYISTLAGVNYGQGICLVLCLISTMNTISAPSISLEGNKLWFPKTIPVPAIVFFRSKIAAHFFLSLPLTLISSLVCAVMLADSIVSAVMMIVLPLATALLCAVLGVAVNLKFPKFDWINEITVIKQGASTAIAMFGGMFILIVPAVLFVLGSRMEINSGLLFCGFLAYLLALSGALYATIAKNSEKKLLEL